MPEPSDARRRFLRALDTRLPLPAHEREEVLEEIAAHLDDAMEELAATGITGDEAERRAEARLGPPVILADDLTRARQSPRRTLVAVGTGAWVGVRDGLGGLVVGYFAVFVIGLAAAGTVQLIGQALGTGWALHFADQGWNSLMVALASLAASFQAGRGITPAVSVASRRRPADVRRWVLVVGTLLVATVAVYIVRMPQNWASVIGWLAVPFGFMLGVGRPTLLPSWIGHRLTVGLALLLIFTLSIGLLLSVTGSMGGVVAENGGAVSYQGPRGLGYEVIGPEWSADDLPSATTAFHDGLETVTITAGATVRQLHDLRIEAWPTAEPPSEMLISPDAVAPIAVGSARLEDGSIRGSVRVDAAPGSTWYAIFATGIGPDGVRYRIATSCCMQATFRGSVWDWIVAVAR